ncbi:MAG: hypothetical protein HRT54_07570 [Colwellia sp.]|nr:hypothetical protein [Colwellia sp.]
MTKGKITQETARKNEAVFKEVTDSMTDQDWENIYNSKEKKANRKELQLICEFVDRGTLRNKVIRRMLHDIENDLRARGVYPELEPEEGKKGGGAADTSESNTKDLPIGAISVAEAAKLHQRILELESENEAIKSNYERFSEVAEVYRRLGEMK